MLYLILAILSSAMVAVIMRLSNARAKNKTVMLAFNYLACSVTGFLFMDGAQIFPAAQGLPFALFMGIVGGAMYLCGFLLLQWNILKNGVVLPATFQKLGVLVPTALALLIFGETPTALQIVGFAAALIAILMIQGGGSGETRKSSLGLIALMLMGGSVDALGKFYEEWGNPAIKDQYLFYIFVCALIYAVALCAIKKQRAAAWDALFGVMVGIPNYLCSRFLLLSLSSVEAVVAYPTFSVGTIVTVTLVGVFFFKERLSRRQIIALGIILVALALLNM